MPNIAAAAALRSRSTWGLSSPCPETPRIMRPQAHLQAQAEDRVLQRRTTLNYEEPGMPRPSPDHRTTPLNVVLREYIQHYTFHRPHRSLHQHPPAGGTPPHSGAATRVLRRDRLGGLLH